MYPIPFPAEYFGDLSAAFIPVFIDSSSNEFEIGLVDGPFSDGNGQHSHSISEQDRRRQQKMHEIEKKFVEKESSGKLDGLLVEMKNRELKMGWRF